MVYTGSLLPLGAAIIGGSLAWFTGRRPRPLSPKQWFFIGLNLSTALWCFSMFVLSNYAPGMEAGAFPYSDPGYVISVLLNLGIAASTLFWFLFAAEHAGARTWSRKPLVWLAVLPGAYQILVTTTNPSHHLFLTQAGPSNPVKAGPLVYPYLVGTYILAVVGMYWLIRGSWTRRTKDARTQAVLLGITSLVAVLAGAVWQLRGIVPLNLQVNPMPIAFAALQIVLVREVVTGGLADLLPAARASAFDAMHDAAIVLDRQLRVVTVNRAADRIFPMLEEGMPIDDYLTTLGQHARTCLDRHPEGVNFEADLGGSVYWGRVRRTGGHGEGCLILLTDLTDLREAQAELMRLGVEPGPSTVRFAVSRPQQRV